MRIAPIMKLLSKLEGKYIVACSGGADSMAALHYLFSRRHIKIAGAINIIHQDETNFCYEAAGLVRGYCETLSIPCHIFESDERFESNREHQWRNERYAFMKSMQRDILRETGELITVVTAHHLDDALETYLMSFLKSGTNHTKVIPYSRREPHTIRPFLLNKKAEMRAYCLKWNIPFLDDPMNELGNCSRSIIRHQIVPLVLSVNPGIYRQVEKLIREGASCD